MVGGIDMQGTSRGPPSTVGSHGLKGPVKGHMALKSSALSPTTTRLSNQYLVQDHMSAHYRRVTSARAAVDTRPPKSMAISTKVRDRQKRERDSRMSSRASSRGSCFRDYTPPRTGRYGDLTYERDLSYDDFNLVDDIVEDTRHSPSSYRTPRPMTSNIPTEWQQKPRTDMKNYHAAMSATKKWDQKDLLDTQPHKFTESAKPYTPRTLKREAQSRIAQSKNYNPPKRKTEKSDSKRNEMLSTKNTYADYNGEIERTQTTSQTLNKTMRYSDIEKTRQGLVPMLKIQRDADHEKWVEEQTRMVEKMKLGGDDEYMNGTMMRTRSSDVDFTLQQSTTKPFYSTTRYSKRLNSLRVKEEEEELKYLEFVTDVTNDVLNRGIYSNRVLKQIFNKHVERKRGELDEHRMLRLMDQLRQDLGIPMHDD